VHKADRTTTAPETRPNPGSWRRALTWIDWQTWVLIYLALPFAMFTAFWIRPIYGWPILACLIFAIVRQAKRERDLAPRIFGGPIELISLLIVAVVWVGLSGAGGWGTQNPDYVKHTNILRDLMAESWPVVYETDGKTNLLVYYFAWYLPPAAVGKMFGWQAAHTAQYWWSVLGVFLTFSYVASVVRGRWPGWVVAAIFALLSGMDILAQLAAGSLPVGTAHIEVASGATMLQYSSNTSALFWVPHQAIFAWLGSAFLLSSVASQRVGAVFLVTVLGALWAPFCMVGLIPINLALVLKVPWRRFLTFENVVGATLVTLVLAPFIASNRMDFPALFLWKVIELADRWPSIAIFYLTEFVVLIWFLGRPSGSATFRVVWWCCMGWLALCPIYFAGQFSDFTMRASLPALFVLWIYVVEKLSSRPWNSPDFKVVYLILAIGAFTPAYEFARSLRNWCRMIPGFSSMRIAEWEIAHVKTQYLGEGRSWFGRHLLREGPHAMLRDPTALDRPDESQREAKAWTSRSEPNPSIELTEISAAALDRTEWSWDVGTITFYADGVIASTWGDGTWAIEAPNKIVAQFPGKDSTHHLVFDLHGKSYVATTEYTANRNRGVLIGKKIKAKPSNQ
jgi:hypothetical protein